MLFRARETAMKTGTFIGCGIAACAVALGLLTTACSLRGVSVAVYDDDHDHHVSCVHSATCGHAFDENAGRWIIIRRHVHGPGCGHDYLNGRWIVVRRARVVHREPEIHVVEVDRCHHHHGCPHVYDGVRWIVVKSGHRHGPGCGHDFFDGRWVVHVRKVSPSRRSSPPPPPRKLRVHHSHDASCGCVWIKGDWVAGEPGHAHGRGCGHVLVRGRWTVR
jgi:hypothetical protein